MKVFVRPDADQVRAVNFLYRRDAGLVNYATGAGKTVIEILTAFVQVRDGLADRFLFVGTPSSTIEIETDFAANTDIEPALIKTVEDLESWVEGSNPFGVTQYNSVQSWVETQVYDSLRHRFKTAVDAAQRNRVLGILQKGRTGVNLDEYHTVKNPQTGARQAFDALRPGFVRTYGYTATSIMSKIYDLYYLVNYLDPELLGTKSLFEERFVEIHRRKIRRPGGGYRIFPEVVGFRNLEILRSLLSRVLVTYFPKMNIRFAYQGAEIQDWDAYYDAAEGVFRKGGEKPARTYRSEELPEAAPSDSRETKSFAARLVDLQHVVNADPGKQRAFLEALRPRLPQGVLVYCSYYDTLDRIKALLDSEKIPWDEITGKRTKAKRRVSKEWFVSDPAGKVLLITAAGGQSLNLQATNTMILYDIPQGVGKFCQTIGRVCRKYSDHDAFEIVVITAAGTVDEYKQQYVEMHRPLIETLLSNNLLPDSRFPSFSSHLLRKLRQALLWRKRNKKQAQ